MTETPPSTGIPIVLPPSWEWRLKQDAVSFSPHLLRLRWRVGDPISSIRVLDNARDANSPQQPYDPDTHPIASEPFTQRLPVSSIDIFIAPLDYWEEWWLNEHDTHAEFDSEYGLASFGARMVFPTPADSEWWLVEDMAEEEGKEVDDDDFEIPAVRRVHCCGLDRPPSKSPRLTVRASSEGGVLTIGDWIAGVHALLGQERENIMACRGVYHGSQTSIVQPDEVLYVDPTSRHAGVEIIGDRDVVRRHRVQISAPRPLARTPGTWDEEFQRWAEEPALRKAREARNAEEAAKGAAGMPPCICWRSKEEPCFRATMAGAPCYPNPDDVPIYSDVGAPNTWWRLGWNGYTGPPRESHL
ncbi:hypothetical protein B0T11DRAFT_338629 [Plectosphaerella cucumerina]|uniref:Uncharacterized protein n=1 Tax=Plectosphaerella cucumerina TaxID=40658 RepID=A0A8K0TDT8_9PEZI|nr:hypothetical protein B0T11DRAFT_338629 [Plectosphaerella cucumerina]